MGKFGAGLVCWVAAALVGGVAAAQPAESEAPIPVVGARSGIAKTGQRPARKNIETLWDQRGEHWDLYILALSSFQDVNETDPLSYFAISGIHGIPYSAWNGVGNVDGAPEHHGYCPHGETIFPTWHRPFVALFEQELVSHAVRIADQYPADLSPQYKVAAQTLRQPYWDWPSQSSLPTAVTHKNVTVRGPNGVQTMRNPLYSYRFQRQSVIDAFRGSMETRRCAGSLGNNATASDARLSSDSEYLRSQVYQGFIKPGNFETMASAFEYPHNAVHNDAGCGGTMAALDWSAFEPLFWLHHCNVDRLVALWQALYFDEPMFTSTEKSKGQFGTAKDANITANSPLKPFFNEDIEFWTSNTVANISVFGYTYDDIEDDWMLTRDELADVIRSRVMELYGDSSDNEQTTRRNEYFGVPHPIHQSERHYYTAEVSVNRSEIPLPSTIELHLGGTVIGQMSFLAMPDEGTAFVSLPLGRLSIGNESLEAVDPERAVDFIEENLTLDIRLVNDTRVSVAQAPSLQVEIQAIEYYRPQLNSTSFPRFGNATKRPVAVRPSSLY